MNPEPFIPAFNWQQHVIAPWNAELPITLWIVLMGFFVTASCGLVGNYLILRRMALVGDAISHSVLAGIAGVIVFTGHLQVTGLFMLDVTIVISSPLILSTLSKFTSGNTICSLIPKE